MLSLTARLIAQGVALSGVVVGSVAFASSDKSLDLTVDGRTTAVHAFGSTVGDVLDSEGIAVGEHDLVSPGPNTKVEDGTEVVVRYGRKLTVTTDGTTREHWTTALTVDEALTQVGLRSGNTKLSVSRSLPLGRTGLQMSANSRKDVRLMVGGKPMNRTTFTASVGDLLAESQVKVGPLDRLSATPATRLADGASITLTRVQRKPAAAAVAVPYAVTKVRSDALTKGTTKVKTDGKAGTARITYLDTWVDGRRTERETTGRTVIASPVAEVVLVGTKPQDDSTAGIATRSGGLNWAALARCESGGNPRAVNPNGHYGLYQFSMQTWAGVGGSGNPANASVAEQNRRAQILYDRSGAGQWSCGGNLFR